MKKIWLTAILGIGIAVGSFAHNENDEKAENFDWLIEELYGLENEKQDLDVLKEMVYIYDTDGNEVVKFEAAAYDSLNTEIKRKIQLSEFMFESLGDQVYMLD